MSMSLFKPQLQDDATATACIDSAPETPRTAPQHLGGDDR